MLPDISVVVPTHDRAGRLEALVRALEHQTLRAERFEVVVVDDCSSDGTGAELDRLAASSSVQVLALTTPINAGPAAARNLGWRKASAPLLAFIDDDCIPEPGWLEAGFEALSADERAGVLQGATRAPEPFRPGDFADHFVWRVIDAPTPYFEACNIFYRKAALEEVGGFDEDIGWWGEDVAAGWKVVGAGWGRGFVSGAVATHPVERRGWRWHLDAGLLDTNLVGLAKRYPGFRKEAFWRPWAYRREDAAFAIALAGLIAGCRWRPALLAALPYCWLRRPSVRRLTFFRLCLQVPVIDLARFVGQVRGAVRYRVAVL